MTDASTSPVFSEAAFPLNFTDVQFSAAAPSNSVLAFARTPFSEAALAASSWQSSNAKSEKSIEEWTLADFQRHYSDLCEMAKARGFEPWKKYAGTDFVSDVSKIKLETLGSFPCTDPKAKEFYKAQAGVLWNVEEIEFERDTGCYQKLSPGQQHMYRMIIAFFHGADALVASQLVNFSEEAETLEESYFLAVQAHIENVHQESYSAAVEIIGDDAVIKEVLHTANNSPGIKAKWQFFLDSRNSSRSKSYRYMSAAFAEGVFFSSMFSAIHLFRSTGKMQAFCFANEWIARDEIMHRDFNCAMAKRYCDFDVEEAMAMARTVYEIECNHIREMMLVPFDSVEADAALGFTQETMERQAQSLVDQVLEKMGFPVLFGVGTVDTPWLVPIAVKANFYENKVSAYQTGSKAEAMEKDLSKGASVEHFENCGGVDF